MKRTFWTSEKLLGLSALFVSACTLFVLTYQVNLIRRQQYMSVYPHLQMSNYGSGLTYRYILQNEGIGPALIKYIHISHGDKVYHDFVDYVNAHVQSKDSIAYFHSNVFPGRLIPAKEKIEVIGLFDSEMTASMGLPDNTLKSSRKLRKVLNADGLDIKIVYKSIYGETWTIDNHDNIPQKH